MLLPEAGGERGSRSRNGDVTRAALRRLSSQLQQQLYPGQVDPPQLAPSLAVLRLQTLCKPTNSCFQPIFELFLGR